ncbi:MAG: glycosyltransferase family 4 protein [Terriglobales bacterium]
MRILYISYFGALKHLAQTQVVPYLRELVRSGCEVTLLSFEECLPDPAEEKRQRRKLQTELAAAAIDWRPLRYHKRPSLPATAYDVLAGIVYGCYLVLSKRINVVHARNHVPAAMALVIKRLLRTRLVFDLRGVMAEEYVDAGTWKQGSVPYRVTKWVEGKVFTAADAVIMLTRKIRDVLLECYPALRSKPVEIIPCCVDVARYAGVDRAFARQRLGLENKLVMAYAGNLGGWYLTAEMARIFHELRRKDTRAHFLIVTQSPYHSIREPLTALGVPASTYTLLTVPVEAMPAHLAAADFAISFIKPCFSKLSSYPTKIGEYLASGLPILTNSGIGDLDELVEGERVGVLVNELSPDSYRTALANLMNLLSDPAIAARCREVAARRLALATVGREGYLRVYGSLGLPLRSSAAAAANEVA